MKNSMYLLIIPYFAMLNKIFIEKIFNPDADFMTSKHNHNHNHKIGV